MSGPPPGVVDRADTLSTEIGEWTGDSGGLWRITGPATSGKSALLRLLSERLQRSILISPPTRAADSPLIGLLQVCGSLKDRFGGNGALDTIVRPEGTWAHKLQALRAWLHQHGQGVVLLCDEPAEWRPPEHRESYFSDCASSLVYTLLEDGPWHRVVTGQIPEGISAHGRSVLALASSPRWWLSDASAWGSLGDTALRLWQSQGEKLQEFSPLELRLLVAYDVIAEASGGGERLDPHDARSRRELSGTVARLLSHDRRWIPLRRAWAQLSLLRLPFDEVLLEQFGTAGLDEISKAILTSCLLYREGERWILHDMLRADAVAHRWLSSEEGRRLHQDLAEAYAARFRSAEAVAEQLTNEAEAFHHSSSAGDPRTADRFTAYFVQQLNVLGRTLSFEARDFESAARVFRRSLKWDPDDSYANHYLAYNLDCLALAPEEVEGYYRRAVDLQPRHAWWHSRWICFLISQGRTRDARTAWDNALDALETSSSDLALYRHLHRWVAALLLHRAELDFGRLVLDAVPGQLREDDAELRSLWRLHRAMVEAETHGALTPASYMLRSQEWWREGPFLLEPELRQGHKLVRWFAGRVDDVSDRELYLRVADVSIGEPASSVKYASMTIPPTKLDEWKFEGNSDQFTVGRFFELGIYRGESGESEQRILLHRGKRWSDVDVLPQLKPDPERYLRRS